MKAFNIKRFIGTAAVMTLTIASLSAQAAELAYEFNGTVDNNPAAGGLFTVDIGGSIKTFFSADAGGDGTIDDGSPGDFNETLGFIDDGAAAGGIADAANRTPTRFAVRNINDSLVLPALRFGNTTASTLTVDNLGNITGGSVSLNVTAVPTNAVLDLTINASANTWQLYGGAGTILLASGTGAFNFIVEPEPQPEAANVPVMPAFMMVLSGLGLLLIGRRQLKSYVKA